MNPDLLFYGATLEEALKKAAAKFNTTVEKLDYEVISKRSRGLFGIGRKEYSIKVRLKPDEDLLPTSKSELLYMQQITDAEAVAKDCDGCFKIEYCDDGVYLTVYPATGNGKAVDNDDVYKELLYKKVQDIDMETIRQAVLESSGRALKIAPPQEEYFQDAVIDITVTRDALQAYAVVRPPVGKGAEPSIQAVENALNEAGIVFGIKQDAVKKLTDPNFYGKTLLIAEATPPEDGEDGYIKYLFDTKRDMTPKLKEDGRVDFFNLKLINNVTSGQELAIKVPPKPGKPGCDVYGKQIKQKAGKDVRILAGKNVVLSEDMSKAFAKINGQVVLIDGKVHVYPVYEVKGDVDTSVGNIDFVGNVVVNGNVRGGFSIRAEGDIEIHGAVEEARIWAGGNIILKRGIQGRDKGSLYANGNIVAKYIEHSNVECLADLIVADAIMHSNVNVGGRVEVSGKKGLIVGGTIRAGEEVKAKNIGSPFATQTEIEVGINPIIKQKYVDTKLKIDNLKKNINKLEQGIELLLKLEKTIGLPQEKQALLRKFQSARENLYNNLAILEEESRNYEAEIANIDKGIVKTLENIYPGVKITIGTASMQVKDTIPGGTLYKSDTGIKIGPY